MEESTPPPVIAASPVPPAIPTATPAPALDRAAIVQSNPVIRNGVGWFWWIAGITLINTALSYGKSEDENPTILVLGLGFTMMVDGIFKNHIAFGLIVDALVLAAVLGLGFGAKKGYVWAFVVGIILYSFDALIYVLGQMWLGVVIHGVALFYLIRGAAALRQHLKAAAA